MTLVSNLISVRSPFSVMSLSSDADLLEDGVSLGLAGMSWDWPGVEPAEDTML